MTTVLALLLILVGIGLLLLWAVNSWRDRLEYGVPDSEIVVGWIEAHRVVRMRRTK